MSLLATHSDTDPLFAPFVTLHYGGISHRRNLRPRYPRRRLLGLVSAYFPVPIRRDQPPLLDHVGASADLIKRLPDA